MYGFKQTEAYREAFGNDAAAVLDTDTKTQAQIGSEQVGPSTAARKSKAKVKPQPKIKVVAATETQAEKPTVAYRFSYPRLFSIVRQLISFSLLLSVLPYTLIFEVRLFWWNYASIPDWLRQPSWKNVDNSVIGGLVKFAEIGGGRRAGQDLYTTGDLLRLLLHWLLVLAFVLFIYGVGNDIELTPEHFMVRYAGRWRKVRWQQVSLVRTIELSTERLIVLVQIKGWGLTWLHRVYSLLLGAGWRKGVIISSDIKDFNNLLQYLAYYKSQKLNQTPEEIQAARNPAELFVHDGFVSPVLQGVLEPSEIMDAAIDEMPLHLKNNAPRWLTLSERAELLPKMAIVAAVVPVLYLTGAVLTWSQFSAWTVMGAALLFGLGMLEWVFASYLIYESGRQFALTGGWGNALLAYPYLQGVRIVAGLVALALTIAVAPGWLVFVIMAAACVWGAVLTLMFTARLYDFSYQKAALAGGGVLLYQAAFLAFYLLVK